MDYGTRPKNAPPPVEFNDMANAPRDGTWLILDVDDGSCDGFDYSVSNIYVGRWNPKCYPDIGPHEYEWEVVDRHPDEQFGGGTVTTHYAAGRVAGWLPLPSA